MTEEPAKGICPLNTLNTLKEERLLHLQQNIEIKVSGHFP